ncbi:MAG: solute carrier family 23 protein [Muricomes sp.]
MKTETAKSSKYDLIYQLDGRPPFKVAFPLGLQHVMAMFVGNLAPIFILTGAMSPEGGEPFPPELRVMMIQAAMLVSGLVTLLQLYPLKLGIIQIGARLPIVMGTAFAFVPTMKNIAAKLMAEQIAPETAMGYVLGGVIAGSLIELIMGIFLKKLKRFFPPIVIGAVLITIGINLLGTGAKYFVGGSGAEKLVNGQVTGDIGSAKYWIVGGVVFLIVVLLNRFGKGMLKATAILIGVIVGYILAAVMGMVNFDLVSSSAWFSLPRPLAITPLFRMDVIFPFLAVYIVAGLETMGNTNGITISGLGREATAEETSGGVIADAVGCALAGLFSALPSTAFGQNAGIVAMTKVVNRFCIALGACVLIVAGMFPKIGAIFSAMPDCVMGGAVITVFAMIFLNGVKMILQDGMNPVNDLILAITLGLGYGVGNLSAGIKENFPPVFHFIFEEPVAAVCIVSVIACLVFRPHGKAAEAAEGESSTGAH